ncbi:MULTISPECIES: helix-turn-helix domain-containing protein [Halorussus]|uniref:helix-turn-helix domain-containing protein n=1 Tax=Halorussus TaxID=1070314 RepID=UPI000E20ED06|nr:MULTISPECIES: helix-turn-helix domain-containing protein [Halorussus]NHN58122.1 bacterio-opsin activator [Halorussus sp. JP-T4]
MPRARLTVTLPADTWIASLSKAYPDAVFRVVATLGGEETGVALVELVTDDPVPVVTDIERQPDVTDLALLWKRDDEALLQVETADPLPLAPVWRAGVPLRLPFEIRDGRTTWETTTTDERLSAFGEALVEAGVEFDVEHVRRVDATPADRLLTDRQLEVLRAAVELGYYETPRTATLTEVAESLGVTTATASDVLHRAEGKLVDWFLDEAAPDVR